MSCAVVLTIKVLKLVNIMKHMLRVLLGLVYILSIKFLRGPPSLPPNFASQVILTIKLLSLSTHVNSKILRSPRSRNGTSLKYLVIKGYISYSLMAC